MDPTSGLKCNKLHWGFKTGEERAQHCLRRAEQARHNGNRTPGSKAEAALFWEREAAKAMKGEH